MSRDRESPVLASILPGLREIRAPLAAGYLFLISAWVLLHDRVNTGRGASSAVDAILELKDQLGPAAFAAAVSFAAYLLGALWEPAASIPERTLWNTLARYRDWRFGRIFREDPDLVQARRRGHSEFWRPGGARVSASSWSQLWTVARRLFSDVDEEVRARLATPEPADDPRRLLAISRRAEAFRREVGSQLGQPYEGPVLGLDDSYPHAADVARTVRAWDEAREPYEGFHYADPIRNWIDAMVESWKKPDRSEGERRKELDPDALALPPEFADPITVTLDSRRGAWWARQLPRSFRRCEFPFQFYGEVGARSEYPGEMGDLPLVVIKRADEQEATLLELGAVVNDIFSELPLSARRLVGEEQELFLESDRMAGEIKFRFALAVPLALTVTIFAIQLSLSWWITTAILTAGWAAGFALLLDGWRRDRERNDVLIALLAINKAKSPTFERLLERAKALSPQADFPAIEAS